MFICKFTLFIKMMLYIIKMPKAGLQDQYIYLNYTERKLCGVGCLLGPGTKRGACVRACVRASVRVCSIMNNRSR